MTEHFNRLLTGSVAFSIVSSVLLYYIDKWELIPQLWVSVAVAMLTYWACYSTSEKLRLDLFDKRFEVYSKTLEYCGVVLRHASLNPNQNNHDEIEKAQAPAHESFRGIGYHKARALFGPDIQELFSKLNDSYAYISAFAHKKDETYHKHLTQTMEIARKLPDHFKPYMYFGDIKQS